jgi:hypothetical protein
VKREKKPVPPEAAPVQTRSKKPAEREATPAGVRRPSPDFERELQDHFAAEERKKVEEATENIFGTVLARHGWVRNEHGQVEYIGGEGA